MAESHKARVLARYPSAVCTKSPATGYYRVRLSEDHSPGAMWKSATMAWAAAAEALEPEPADVAETRLDSIRADAAANPDRVFIVGDEPSAIPEVTEAIAGVREAVAAPACLPIYFRDEQQKIAHLEASGLVEGEDFVIHDWPSHPTHPPEGVRLRDVDVKVSGATLETPRLAIVGPGDGRFAERLDLARMADGIVAASAAVSVPLAILDDPMMLPSPGVVLRESLDIRDFTPEPDVFIKGKPFPKHGGQQRPPQNMAQHAKAKRHMQRASRRANRGR